MTASATTVRDLAGRGIYVGITAWTEPTLIETGFYPADATTPEERLRYYATQFPITEVDSTYYSPPSERVAKLWVERTPADFVFDIKAFRLLTHHPTPHKSLWRDLRDELPAEVTAARNVYAEKLPPEMLDDALDRFIGALHPLREAGKLGVVLFQFPQYFFPSRTSYAYMEWLADRLEDAGVTGAIEFRQHSWMDGERIERVLEFLRSHGLAYVSVDEPQGFVSSVPPIAAATAGVAIVRFHGRNQDTWQQKGVTAAERFAYDYTEHPGELEEWVPRVSALHEEGRPVHALMNNCYSDYAVKSGQYLAQLLNAEPA
ncbi:MAG: hypothetical protein JWL83_1096 [Actinomycetia bacterium]|nr:hypothetical protein [Actinomycetes bacterium]